MCDFAFNFNLWFLTVTVNIILSTLVRQTV